MTDQLATEAELTGKLKEVKTSADQVAEALPKGNEIEQAMTGAANAPQPTAAAPKRGRGRPKKVQAADPTAPQAEQADHRGVDPIAQMANGMLVPVLCMNGIPYLAPGEQKDPAKVMLTKEQQDALLTMAPEGGLPERSWFLYGISMLGMIMTNFFMAPSLPKPKPDERADNVNNDNPNELRRREPEPPVLVPEVI